MVDVAVNLSPGNHKRGIVKEMNYILMNVKFSLKYMDKDILKNMEIIY